MNNVKAIQRITETELRHGSGKKSWHDIYSGSAYIFIGGLHYDLTEGDVLAIFSQYGEIMNINLVRDKKTGKTKGFCFLCYENQKSTVLAVDNLNGIKVCGRTIRVDHVTEYRRPKDEHGNEIVEQGCAPKTPTPSPEPSESESEVEIPKTKKKKGKKSKDKKKKNKRKERVESDTSDSDQDRRGPRHRTGEKQSTSRHHKEAFGSLKHLRVADREQNRETKRISTKEDHFVSRDRRRDSPELSHRHKERKIYRDRSRSRSRDRKYRE